MNSFQKFLERHAGELRQLSGVIATLLPALPINPEDKAKVVEHLNELNAASDRIIASVAGVSFPGGQVVVKESDVEVAVSRLLPALVTNEVDRQLHATTRGPDRGADYVEPLHGSDFIAPSPDLEPAPEPIAEPIAPAPTSEDNPDSDQGRQLGTSLDG